MSNWTTVKAAVIDMVEEMSVSTGYNYDYAYYNRTDIVQPADIYISMDTPDGEKNNDADTGTGTGSYQYDNERELNFYVNISSTAAYTTLDTVVETVEDKLELALDDLKHKFKDTKNAALCASGVYYIQYATMEWVEDTEALADVFAPKKMIVKFIIKYRQTR